MKLLEAVNRLRDWQSIKVKAFTQYGYDGNLRQFCVFCRNKELEKITIDDIVEFLNWQKKVGLKGSAIDKKAIAIKNLLKYYYDQNYHVVKPSLVPLPPKDKVLPRVADDKDYYILMNIIPKSGAYFHIRNRAIISLLYDTGCRAGEIISLNIDDIDIKNKRITIKTEKDRSDAPFRKAFFRDATIVYLNTWLKKREKLLQEVEVEDNEALFISVNGGYGGSIGRRMAENALCEMLRKYSRSAGLPYTINAHSFRHRVGRELAKRDCNNSQISGILGHKNIASSQIYTILNNFDLEKIYHKVIGK